MIDGSSVEAGTAERLTFEYTVVLRALSSARFLPEEGWEFHFESVPGLGLGAVRVRAFTRWAAAGENSVPRELIVEVRGHAGSLDEAARKFQVIASPIAAMIGFTANVRVGLLEVHLAYESSVGATERQFLEVFIPDERGAVTDGRIVRRDLLEAACLAFFALEKENGQVGRALRQYELALRQWHLGGEWLALSHLYMGVEALTEAVLRKARADGRFATSGELARSLGVNIDGPDRRDKQNEFRGRLREQMIFGGDTDTYQTAKDASDGLEHGFMELDEVARHAVKCADKTFHHVRRTIIELLRLPDDVAEELIAIKPKDVQSRRKVIRGRLTGAAEDPAAEGELYPRLEWTSSVASVTRDGSRFQFRDTDKVTVRTHADVTFQLDQLLVYGRLEDGHVPVQVDNSDALMGPTPEPKSVRLLAAVMPLVNAATANAAETRQTRPRVLAFNLFAQGVASFEAVQLLISDKRSVEALPVLRNLVFIASRFEEMISEDGPGIGIVLRMALDMPEEIGATAETSAMYREQILSSAASAGVTVPGELPAPDASAIHVSLRGEMQLARGVVDGTYAATLPHLKHQDADHSAFYTQVEPGPFTELIASACVIAQLELLKSAARLLSWPIDQQEIHGLLVEARELNEASVIFESQPGEPEVPNLRGLQA